MQRSTSTKMSERTGLVIQRVPLYCRSPQTITYRLDVTVAGRMSPKVVEEWSALVADVKGLRTTFLVSLGEDLTALRSVKLPRNMLIERPGHCLDGSQYRIGEKVYTLGWEALYKESSATPGKLAPTLSVLINLLSCLRRDADLSEVVDVIKSDPVVQYNLVHYLDRAHLGFDYKFKTFEQAVMVMGYRTLERWLATFLLWSNVKHYMPELCRLALTRGRQMELITQRQGLGENTCGLAYITGVFSALPGILGIPLEAALKPLSPDDIIVTTLTDRAGPLAASLQHVQATEGGPAKAVVQHLQEIGVPVREANHVMVQSMLFAERQVTQ